MIREEIILDKIKNKDVLDIGSVGQTGAYSLWKLYKTVNYKSLTGIDLPDSKASAQAFFKLKDNDLNLDSDIVYGNMETFMFEKKFDVIIAGDVIEHVNNQGLFLENIFNHLKDDGELIITTPNSKWITGLLKPNPTHNLWHDKYTLGRVLEINGFSITHFRYYYGNKKSYNLFAKILTWRQAMLVICKKAQKSMKY